jgi:hypothetical protein
LLETERFSPGFDGHTDNQEETFMESAKSIGGHKTASHLRQWTITDKDKQTAWNLKLTSQSVAVSKGQSN